MARRTVNQPLLLSLTVSLLLAGNSLPAPAKKSGGETKSPAASTAPSPALDLSSAASAKDTAPDTIRQLEKRLFFKNYPDEELAFRVTRIEKKMFGEPMTSSALPDRISRLEEVLRQQLAEEQKQKELEAAKNPPPAAKPVDKQAEQEDQIERARESIQEAREKEISGLLSEGVNLFRQKRGTQAQEKFEQVLRLDPTNSQAHFNLGIIHESMGNYIEALASYKQAAHAEPDNKDFSDAVAAVESKANKQQHMSGQRAELRQLAEEANASWKRGEYMSALDKYLQLDQKEPNSALVKYNIGSIYLMLKDQINALNYYKDAHKLAPNEAKYTKAYNELSTALKKAGKEQSEIEQAAIKDYNEANTPPPQQKGNVRGGQQVQNSGGRQPMRTLGSGGMQQNAQHQQQPNMQHGMQGGGMQTGMQHGGMNNTAMQHGGMNNMGMQHGGMQQGYAGGGMNNGMHQGGMQQGYAGGGMNNGMHQGGMQQGYAGGGMNNGMHQTGMNNMGMQGGMNGGMQGGMNNGMQGGMNNMGMQGGMNNMGVQGGMNNGMQGGMNNGMQGGMNNGMQGMNNGMGMQGMNNGMGMQGMNNGMGMQGMNNGMGMQGMNNGMGMQGMNNGMGMQGGMNTGMQGGMNTGMQGGMNTGMQGGMNSGMQGGMNSGMQGGMNNGMQGGMNNGMGMQGGMNSGMQGGMNTGMQGNVQQSNGYAGLTQAPGNNSPFAPMMVAGNQGGQAPKQMGRSSFGAGNPAVKQLSGQPTGANNMLVLGGTGGGAGGGSMSSYGISGRSNGEGVTVTGIGAASRAQSAGLLPGDDIKTVDGTEVTSPDDINRVLSQRQSSDKFPVVIMRKGNLVVINL